MTEYLWDQSGGTKFPTQSQNLNPAALTFEGIDPALETLSALFVAAIRAEFGEVWPTICASLPRGAVLKDSLEPVGAVLKIEPNARILTELKCGWPLFAIHRTGSAEFIDLSIQKEALTQPWLVHYILGPLTAGEAHKLAPLLQAVGKLIHRVIRLRAHPNYKGGALQFGEGAGDLCNIVCKGFESGAARVAEDDPASFYAVAISIETTETVKSLYDGPEFQGLDGNLNVGDSGELTNSLVQFNTDYGRTR